MCACANVCKYITSQVSAVCFNTSLYFYSRREVITLKSKKNRIIQRL